MRFGVLCGGTGWHVQDLLRAARAAGHSAEAIDFRRITAEVPAKPLPFDALLVRTMPAGSLEQIVFRMDALHGAVGAGVPVLNPPRALETCIDKYLTTARLAEAGLPVPRTVCTQTAADAMATFADLGGDLVVKPIFGSEGRGMIRLTDREVAWRTFHAIEQTDGVLYLQEFVHHPGWDVRAFVLGDRVLAAMKRFGHGDWRTNVAQGGTTEPCDLGDEPKALALAAARATGALVAGVDLIRDLAGRWLVLEVNAVPGWKALATACGVDVAAAVVRFLEGWA